MEEYDRVREQALLTDEEIQEARFQASCSRGYGARTDDVIDKVAEKVSQAQLEKALNHPDVLIRAADQSLPEELHIGGIRYGKNWITEALADILKPDSEGRVWVKCLPNEQ